MCVREKEEGWEEVKRKKGEAKQGVRNQNEFNRVRITKFFVANIPKGCRPWDLETHLKGFGEVAGVYIARKRNKEGLRFGFISFKGVKNWRALEYDLRKVKMGNNMLKINVTRFAMENEESVGKVNKDGYTQDVKGRKVFSSTVQSRNDGMGISYADKVKGIQVGVTEVKAIEVDGSVKAMSSFHDRALVADCVNLNTLWSLSSLLAMSGVKDVEVRYLGGLCVLLTFTEDGLATAFVNSNDSWKMWFSRVEVWKGQSLPFERIAWIKVVGVPLQLKTVGDVQ